MITLPSFLQLIANASRSPNLGTTQSRETLALGQFDVRSQILKFIETYPGSHLRQIKRMLGASMGVVEYHLYVLEKEKKIVSRRTGLYKRFYPALSFGEKDQEILGVLSQETERDILLYVLENPRVTQSDVSGYMQISAASVIWHMKRLIGSGLIEAKREGHYVVYRVDRDRDGILRLLRTYHPGVWETWANRLGDILTDISEQ